MPAAIDEFQANPVIFDKEEVITAGWRLCVQNQSFDVDLCGRLCCRAGETGDGRIRQIADTSGTLAIAGSVAARHLSAAGGFALLRPRATAVTTKCAATSDCIDLV